MELIQIFLPTRDNDGNAFAPGLYQMVKETLANEFGGVTAFLRSPGEGVWEESPQEFIKDDIITFEVMTEKVNTVWWNDYKEELKRRFMQEDVVIRKIRIELL